MKELAVISGKGGTGKTSLAAAFAVLARRPVIVDGDVDAADMHLLLAPVVRERHDFIGGRRAVIRADDCTGCGLCGTLCRFGAVLRLPPGGTAASPAGTPLDCRLCDYCKRTCSVRTDSLIREMETAAGWAGREVYVVDASACEGCGVCVRFCPAGAIDFPECRSGEWMVSQTRCGPMVHARLGAAAENSGKLVSTVRREARRIAEEEGRALIIVDGPPGIGCPVIASVTGASLVLAVTEPTVAGEHDLERVLSLARHFELPAAVCVNKWDLDAEAADRIEARALSLGAKVAGRIRYDPAVSRAQIRERTVVEIDAPCAGDVRTVWSFLEQEMKV